MYKTLALSFVLFLAVDTLQADWKFTGIKEVGRFQIGATHVIDTRTGFVWTIKEAERATQKQIAMQKLYEAEINERFKND